MTPSTPELKLAPIQPPHEKSSAVSSGQTLPPLSSLTGAQAPPPRHVPLPNSPEPSHPAPFSRATNHWPSLNPFTAYYSPSHLQSPEPAFLSMNSDRSSEPRAASVSLDDPDVRMAAEALGHLKTDFMSSPRTLASPQPSMPGDGRASRDYKTSTPLLGSRNSNQPEPEPLLSLITTSYPVLATTIEGAASAYNSSKNYSPHLKSSAEYVESYLNPVAKAVGNVGRKTGVEGGVRWIFGRRSRKQQSASDIETGERGNHKRRKAERDDTGLKIPDGLPQDFGTSNDDRRMSVSTVDTLPAYDDQRSPAYTETADGQPPPGYNPTASGQPWSRRLVVTTSGLGVAMKQESLRSLKYCLKVLKDTNGYIGELLVTLKNTIDEYDLAAQKDGEDHAMADGRDPAPRSVPDRSKLISRMTELRDDLFRAIQRTVQTISKYAGSALPENARNVVHRQLMSLPGLYQLHYVRESSGARRENTTPEAWSRERAHLALLFAREALQMMTQVADVLNRTLVSAEEWCETLYKKKSEQADSPMGSTEPVPPPAGASQDVTMSG